MIGVKRTKRGGGVVERVDTERVNWDLVIRNWSYSSLSLG